MFGMKCKAGPADTCLAQKSGPTGTYDDAEDFGGD